MRSIWYHTMSNASDSFEAPNARAATVAYDQNQSTIGPVRTAFGDAG
jgi:hypothetical protein